MMVSPEYGGAGLDTVSYVLAMEEISKVDASVSVCMSVNNSLVCYGIEAFGTEEQKQKYLAPLAQGKKGRRIVHWCFLLSEPEAGSDATSQKTIAEDKGDHYLLNGTKNWITNGGTAICLPGNCTNRSIERPQGNQRFHCRKNWPGVVVGGKENKLGIRASDTHSIMFNDVKVPKKTGLVTKDSDSNSR
jgi:alkylation response protein AidB-like acyl-CoA dehydrogenase